MIKRLQMAWCGLRGGHALTIRNNQGGSHRDILLDCNRCGWSAIIMRSSGAPLVGRSIQITSIDEAT